MYLLWYYILINEKSLCILSYCLSHKYKYMLLWMYVIYSVDSGYECGSRLKFYCFNLLLHGKDTAYITEPVTKVTSF
jgi:hypothetical protein